MSPEPLQTGELVEFGPLPGGRWERATVVVVEKVLIRFERDGTEMLVKRSLLRPTGETSAREQKDA